MRTTSNAKKATLFLFFLATVLMAGASAVHGQSALDGFDPNANGVVNVVVVQADGKVLVGGNFTTVFGVNRNRIARLGPNGTLDSTFDPNCNFIVDAIALQADGKILVGGTFGTIGGQVRHNMARLDPVTGLADSFNPDASTGDVRSIVVQADGKILVGGLFTSIGGQTRNYIARLDPTTGLADSFNPNASGIPDGYIPAIAVQADGKILAGGNFTSIGGQTRNHIARLDPTTGLADSFNPNANQPVRSIAVQADGKILVGGLFGSIGGQPRNQIARLDFSTGLADSFNPNSSDPNGDVRSIAVQTDGKILASGPFTHIGGQVRYTIARLDPTTGLADSFDPNPSNTVISIAVQTDGKILIGGAFNTLSPNGATAVTRNYIARLETDGRLDGTPEVQLLSVASRKVHGASAFDIDLPLAGNLGVECRSGGAGGDYQLAFSFGNTLISVGSARVTSGTASVSSQMIDADAHNYIVNLTGVSNAQLLTISLTNVNDSAGDSSSTVPISMGVLFGDTNGNGSVSASDIAQAKSQSGQPVDASNFRSDVNVSGSISAGDVGMIKTSAGTALP